VGPALPLAVKDDRINLLEFESGNLDRRAGQDQLLELDLEVREPLRQTARADRLAGQTSNHKIGSYAVATNLAGEFFLG